jgi:hypothetical protein
MKANFSTFYLDLFSLLRIFIFFAISQIIPHMKLLIPVCCGYHNFLHWPNTQNIIISQTESWINLSLQEYTVTRYTLSLYLSRYTGHEVYSLSISLATLSRSIPSLYLSRYTVTRYTLSLSLLLFNYKNSTTRVCLCQSGHHPYLIETQLVLTMI